MIKRIIVLTLLLSVSACATWSTPNVTGGDDQKQNLPQNIIITEGDITNHKYKILGDVQATVNKTTIFNKDPTKEQVNEELQKEAAKLGADAVVFVRYGTVGVSLMSWGSLDGKGRAVVFTD